MARMLTKKQVAVRNKWVKALRSGEYKQTRGMLRVEGAYCCLGVLCDIADNSKWNGHGLYDGDYGFPPHTITSGAGLFRPLDATYTAGDADLFYGEDLHGVLAKLNDKGDFNFDEIADVIELDTLMHEAHAL